MRPERGPNDTVQTIAGDVAALRQFSRYFTRRLGALNDRYLGQDRALGSARLLFEIGSGASLRDLRTRLGLDAGYLSRLIRGLERHAATRGLNVIRLGTHRALTEAIQLYRTSGYAEIPAYGAVAHTDLWFEKRLAPPPREA